MERIRKTKGNKIKKNRGMIDREKPTKELKKEEK